MPAKVIMPQLGESVTEGTILRWYKKAGDTVARFEPMAEIETAKVVTDLPSPVAGVVSRLLVPAGSTVAVGVEIALIEEAVPAGAPAQVPARPAPQAAATPAMQTPVVQMEEKARYSPLVRRLAEEHGVDLSRVRGTGQGGRVTKEDVLRYMEQQQAGEAVAPATAQPPAVAEEEVIPLTPTRRTIAEHMLRSVRTAPHAWATVEADVTRLVGLRESVKEEFRRKEGVDLTYVPFFIRACVEAMREHPLLNSRWAEDRIIVSKRIHIGVAVAAEQGLVVPVIRDADKLGIAGLADALNDLVARARERKLTLEDVEGGTFTVNNPGAFGSILSQPILNQPQAAIITMEAIVRRPVVLEGDTIAIRSIMNLCLSFDHRVMDGAVAGRFLQTVKARLEAMGEGTPLY